MQEPRIYSIECDRGAFMLQEFDNLNVITMKVGFIQRTLSYSGYLNEEGLKHYIGLWLKQII